MSRDVIYTQAAAKPPATYSQAAKLPVKMPGLKVSIACIAEA